MYKRFQDKVALVTGAAQGIGRRVAERLVEEGARVVAVDRSELVFELQDELGAGSGMLALTADLEQFAECHRVAAAAVERFGRLDRPMPNDRGTRESKTRCLRGKLARRRLTLGPDRPIVAEVGLGKCTLILRKI